MAQADNSQTIECTVDELDRMFAEGKTLIEYVANGDGHRNYWSIDSEHDVERFYKILREMLAHPMRRWILVGSELFIHRIRVGVLKGEIDPDSIRFFYDKQLLKLDRRAYFQPWPTGFLSYYDRLLEDMLLLRMESDERGH